MQVVLLVLMSLWGNEWTESQFDKKELLDITYQLKACKVYKKMINYDKEIIKYKDNIIKSQEAQIEILKKDVDVLTKENNNYRFSMWFCILITGLCVVYQFVGVRKKR